MSGRATASFSPFHFHINFSEGQDLEEQSRTCLLCVQGRLKYDLFSVQDLMALDGDNLEVNFAVSPKQLLSLQFQFV